MGDIKEYACEDCSARFEVCVGFFDLDQKESPIPEPKKCINCGSEKIKAMRVVGHSNFATEPFLSFKKETFKDKVVGYIYAHFVQVLLFLFLLFFLATIFLPTMVGIGAWVTISIVVIFLVALLMICIDLRSWYFLCAVLFSFLFFLFINGIGLILLPLEGFLGFVRVALIFVVMFGVIFILSKMWGFA